MKRSVTAVLALIAALFVLTVPAPAQASTACGYTWYATTYFDPDDHFTGCKGTLWMQLDGNLVIYHEYGYPLWASNTAGHDYAYAAFQTDGNLVVYSATGSPLWASNTRAPGGRLVYQDDGNLVIYNRYGTAVWATNTAH
ncbi:hypothetical protein Afil01_37240 [Actinorhabdospora filicis]|uniref:Bulb-type lectin domain-containing protein n=1 Tax=Actinorhabdospora filicis TaxID=1785913 RepID=A0A9W6SNB3_9ACTN|nr:hypothetical protein [Actinorhabdospora filicis]GLZ78917.1 hypothetical protein Afil01_37240 [Actinorhabdospora filicis]